MSLFVDRRYLPSPTVPTIRLFEGVPLRTCVNWVLPIADTVRNVKVQFM